MRRAERLYAVTPPAFASEKNDCAVRALAVAAGHSYEEAHRALKLHGRVDRRGTYNQTMERAAGMLGLRLVEELPGGSHPDFHMPARHHMTLAQFVRVYRSGRYVVRVNRHFIAVVDGVVHDWAWKTSARTRAILAWRQA